MHQIALSLAVLWAVWCFFSDIFCVDIYIYLCVINPLSTCFVEKKHSVIPFSSLAQDRTLSSLLTLSSARDFVLCPYHVKVSYPDPRFPSLGIFVPQLDPPSCHFKAEYFKLFIRRHFYHSSMLAFLISSWILPKMFMSFFKLGASAAAHVLKKGLMREGH